MEAPASTLRLSAGPLTLLGTALGGPREWAGKLGRLGRTDRQALPPVRPVPRLRADPGFVAAERTFATLPGFLAWCAALPGRPGTLLRHLAGRRTFPVEWASA